jgi:hypothetical protein
MMNSPAPNRLRNGDLGDQRRSRLVLQRHFVIMWCDGRGHAASGTGCRKPCASSARSACSSPASTPRCGGGTGTGTSSWPPGPTPAGSARRRRLTPGCASRCTSGSSTTGTPGGSARAATGSARRWSGPGSPLPGGRRACCSPVTWLPGAAATTPHRRCWPRAPAWPGSWTTRPHRRSPPGPQGRPGRGALHGRQRVLFLLTLASSAGLAGDEERALACCRELAALTEPGGEFFGGWCSAYCLWALRLAAWRRGDLDSTSAPQSCSAPPPVCGGRSVRPWPPPVPGGLPAGLHAPGPAGPGRDGVPDRLPPRPGAARRGCRRLRLAAAAGQAAMTTPCLPSAYRTFTTCRWG